MLAQNTIRIVGPGSDYSFRVNCLLSENKDVVEKISSMLPLESFLLHVVVAGETIYFPVPSLSIASRNMVERRPGVLYYNTTSQSICLCYGYVTESTLVNQFGQVLEQDLPNLVRLGKLVYQQTIVQKMPKIVQVTMRHLQDQGQSGASAARPSIAETQYGSENIASWRTAKEIIDNMTALLRLPEEPDEIKMIRLGAVETRVGAEPNPMPTVVFLQGFLSCLGPHVLSRLLSVSNYPDMTVALIVRQTREFLLNTFNHFEFLKDLGLESMMDLGKIYEEGLCSVVTLDEYRELTDSLRTLIQLLYRWVHLVFPWFLKDKFKSHSRQEVEAMPKLERYN